MLNATTRFTDAETESVPKMLKALELYMQERPTSGEAVEISSLSPFTQTLHDLDILKLYDCRGVVGVLRAPNLQVLHIHGKQSILATQSYLAKDLFNTIRGMPLLEDLCLDHAVYFPPSSEELTLVSPHDLPNLKVLTLKGRSDTLLRVLEHLTIPVKVSLNLEFEPRGRVDMSSTEIASLQRVLQVERAGAFKYTEHRTIRALKIEDTPSSLRFTGCTHSGGCVPASTKACVLSSLEIAFVNHKHAVMGAEWSLGGFDEVMNLLPLQEVRALDLRGKYVWESFMRCLGLSPADLAPRATVRHLRPPAYAQTRLESVLSREFSNLQTLSGPRKDQIYEYMPTDGLACDVPDGVYLWDSFKSV